MMVAIILFASMSFPVRYHPNTNSSDSRHTASHCNGSGGRRQRLELDEEQRLELDEEQQEDQEGKEVEEPSLCPTCVLLLTADTAQNPTTLLRLSNPNP